jgi:hypothetical protein
MFSFHHFHSTAHEALGIVSGHAAVVLGGPCGRRFEVRAGDLLLLPAGTGHCNAGSSGELLVVGAYPDGMEWDIRRGDPAEHDEVLANIDAVPLPQSDPVHGPDGPLRQLWRGRLNVHAGTGITDTSLRQAWRSTRWWRQQPTDRGPSTSRNRGTAGRVDTSCRSAGR